MNAVRESLARDGFTVVALGELAAVRLAQPWLLVDAVLGEAPLLVEVQPIRPVAGARSFAASSAPAPWHTDSPLWRGRPPELQLTVCLRPARDGGASLLLDAWQWLASLQRDEPALARQLLTRPRVMPFVFGDVLGPTAALRGGRPCVTHTPRPRPDDTIAVAIAAALEHAPRQRVVLREGEALLLDNHRMLHGREGFADPDRVLARVLAWLERPLGAAPPWTDTAAAIAGHTDAVLTSSPPALRRAFGLEDAPPLELEQRIVLAMLGGAPPGVLAQRFAVPEPALYRMRDRVTGLEPTLWHTRDRVAGPDEPSPAALAEAFRMLDAAFASHR
ncbi:MAG: TauD/TfdA family dioxygenase [Nannocystaceae bacterium]|nr:TauD/TfdA family dioxygenase [Nannocystaceae bacterium]